jgi:transcriptional regulator EpsA
MQLTKNMKTFIYLDSNDLEHLAFTIESAGKIRTSRQFFLWARGALQGFLPHDALLCLRGDISGMKFSHELHTGVALPPRMEEAFANTSNGLMPRLVDDWLRGQAVPRCFSQGSEIQTGRRQLLSDLEKCGFTNVIGHGVHEVQGDFGSFFVLAGMPYCPGPREAYLLDLLMPHLHLALHRSGSSPCSTATPAKKVAVLSKREMQVLHWVKSGKTNCEIGQILGISPLTAKNHMQKVMQKLKVTNRAQAVGKGETLRLLVRGDLEESSPTSH